MKAAGITDAHRVGNVGLYPLGSTSHPTASRVGAPGQQWSVSFGSLALVVSGRQGLRRFRVGRQVRIGRRVFDTVWSVRCRRSGRAVGAISPALASLSGRVITCTIPVTGTSRRGACRQHKWQSGEPDSDRRGNRAGTLSESNPRPGRADFGAAGRRCTETNTL